MDGAVGQRGGENLVHAPVLVDECDAVECPADDGHLEVVAGARPILDLYIGVGKSAGQQCADGLGVHAAMLDTPRYPARVRLFKALLLFKVGFWAGMLTSAALLKRAFPSRGDEESDELRLVAIMDGVAIKSRAQAFRGGSLLSWLGGIAVDLREADLAPDAHLEVGSLFGGIAVRVPTGWRVESGVKTLAGGVAIDVPEPEASDAPTLRVSGVSVFGGVAVGAKPLAS